MGEAGLGSRGSGTCVGSLVPVLHRHDGGFAEEAVLIVHQVLVNASSATAGCASGWCSPLPPPHPPCPRGPRTCRTCGHRAGTQQRWGERSRWGRGLPHWWAAGSRVQGGLGQTPRQGGVHYTHTVVLTCTELLWPHSPGRQLPPAQMQRLGVPTSVPPGPAPPH